MKAFKVIENLPPPPKPMPKCHLPECGRDASPSVPLCEVCRLAYLNGYNDAVLENNGRRAPWTLPPLCHACGHFAHEGAKCAWHGGSCGETLGDSSLWCPCDGKMPNWMGD